jgi:FkbM family methyltransferase
VRAECLSDAKTILTGVCASDEGAVEGWQLLGEVNTRLGIPDEAVRCWQRVAALQPTDYRSHYRLANGLMAMRDFGDAARSFRCALALQPDSQDAMNGYRAAALRAVSNDSFAIQIRDGIVVHVPKSLQLLTPFVLLEQEDWFEDEIAFVRRMAVPGMQVVDIGANYGVYTLSLARRIGAEGRVWSFEPASRTAGFLRRSIVENGCTNITLVQSALSREDGRATLALDANSELNSLTGGAGAGSVTEEVEVTTLDACLARFGWRGIDFVKLDAEGEERNILVGGERFFATQSPLVMYEIRHCDELNLDLMGQFHALGFESYRLLPGLGQLVPFDTEEAPDGYLLNLFCCRPERARALANRGLLVERAGLKAGGPKSRMSSGWRDVLQGLPYAAQYVDAWAGLKPDKPAGAESYRRGLDLWASAHSPDTPPRDRYLQLRQAFAHVEDAVRVYESPLRLQSKARIAWELGQRAVATSALARALQMIIGRPNCDWDEPFLAVSHRIGQVDPRAALSGWMVAGVVEQLERLRAFSSYFLGVKSLQNLETYVSLGCPSPEMERRRQLVRMSLGLQVRPEPSPALGLDSGGELNARFWQSGPDGIW